MKSNFIFIISLSLILVSNTLLSEENLNIVSNEVKIEKQNSEIVFKGNVKANDKSLNYLYTDEAKYFKEKDFLKSVGETKIITSQEYILESQNVEFDNKNNIIKSDYPTTIIDRDGNKIFVNMFNYNSIKNILFSKGEIKMIDKNENTFKFSEIYINEVQNKIIGSDAKLLFEDDSFKIDPENNPRIYANSVSINSNETSVQKGVLTYCKFRENDKCPPWELRAKKIRHDSTKKTIFYDSATLKIYDFPIFYFPKLSHPDPTVKRRSGFLVPSFTDSSNVGFGLQTPYFWNIARDKDITFSPRFYQNHKPLYLAEYRQDFLNSFLIVDGGFTEGYEKISNTRTPGSRSHIFAKFNTILKDTAESFSDITLNLQHLSNSTYAKINKLDTLLVNKDNNIVENSFSYNYQKEDLFFSSNFSAYEDLSKTGNSKYEYMLPDITFEKNIFMSEEIGVLDFQSNFNVRNYDVNKQVEIVSNDFKWNSNSWINKLGFENEFLGLIKNVNYNAKNETKYKTQDEVSELYGALGFKSELGLFKLNQAKRELNIFKPKVLFKISPNHMRDISDDSSRLKYSNLFKLNKIDKIDVIDAGSSVSYGFDFKKNRINSENTVLEEKFKFSLGQVISENENENLPNKTSLNQRFSDVVGSSAIKIGGNSTLKFNFSIDQNLKDLNENEVGLNMIYPKVDFNLSYLEEKQHIGNQKYVNTSAGINLNNGLFKFSTKRNLLTNSAEFYNLSYEYINDCLKAGLAYRREFYLDRDVEPEDSLMFKITFSPFGQITTPTFD